MNRKAIDVLFTETVKEYIEKGLVANTHSMGGIQSGDIARIDLTDGKDIYRILLSRGSDSGWENHDYYHFDVVRLSVLKFSGVKPHLRSWDTLWNDKGEVLSENVFYRFENNSSGENRARKNDNEWYATSIEEVKSANRKNDARRDARRIRSPFGTLYEYPESAKRKLLPLVRRLPRCKTVHLEDIGTVYRCMKDTGNTFHIMVKGKDHVIVVDGDSRRKLGYT